LTPLGDSDTLRTRKKELDAIADMLSNPAESVDDLAKDIWSTIDEARRGRELWVVAVQYKIGQHLFGPYESEAMAQKDLEGRGNLRGMKPDEIGRVFKLLSPVNNFVTEMLQDQGILDFR
jgi:hypothetical protein